MTENEWQTCQLYSLNMCSLLYVNDTLMKLSFKKGIAFGKVKFPLILVLNKTMRLYAVVFMMCSAGQQSSDGSVIGAQATATAYT